jgi:hypothetical protein
MAHIASLDSWVRTQENLEARGMRVRHVWDRRTTFQVLLSFVRGTEYVSVRWHV